MDTFALQRRPLHRWRGMPDRRRRALECAGWRTWLIYTENHRRDDGGRMVAVDGRWTVELEHLDGHSMTVEASSPAAAWLLAWERARGGGAGPKPG